MFEILSKRMKRSGPSRSFLAKVTGHDMMLATRLQRKAQKRQQAVPIARSVAGTQVRRTAIIARYRDTFQRFPGKQVTFVQDGNRTN
jgi:hypothetical protein